MMVLMELMLKRTNLSKRQRNNLIDLVVILVLSLVKAFTVDFAYG